MHLLSNVYKLYKEATDCYVCHKTYIGTNLKVRDRIH